MEGEEEIGVVRPIASLGIASQLREAEQQLPCKDTVAKGRGEHPPGRPRHLHEGDRASVQTHFCLRSISVHLRLLPMCGGAICEAG